MIHYNNQNEYNMTEYFEWIYIILLHMKTKYKNGTHKNILI